MKLSPAWKRELLQWWAKMEKDLYELLQWKSGDSSLIAHTPVFDLYQEQRKTSQNKEGNFVFIKAPDWVNVIAPVPEEHQSADFGTDNQATQFLMVRQFRHGIKNITLEFPAGVVDPGEDPLQAAMRELQEETGYQAGKWLLLGAISPNPALMTNLTHTYLALNLKKVSDLHLDQTEVLTCELIQRNYLEREIEKADQGAMNNAIMVMAWHYYCLWESKKR